MNGKIALVTILTDDVPRLTEFYRDVLGFPVKTDLGGYVEFESEGVRFSICERSTMAKATGDSSYNETPQGHAFELAFPVDSPEAVNRVYEEIVDKGATPIQGPADMPWNQRTAFFADPDGNVHELFADLRSEKDNALQIVKNVELVLTRGFSQNETTLLVDSARSQLHTEPQVSERLHEAIESPEILALTITFAVEVAKAISVSAVAEYLKQAIKLAISNSAYTEVSLKDEGRELSALLTYDGVNADRVAEEAIDAFKTNSRLDKSQLPMEIEGQNIEIKEVISAKGSTKWVKVSNGTVKTYVQSEGKWEDAQGTWTRAPHEENREDT